MLVCLLSFTFLYFFITCIAAFVRNKTDDDDDDDRRPR